MPDEKELAKKVLERLRLVTAPGIEMFQDDIISSVHKKVFSYKNIEEIIPRGDPMIGEARRCLDDRQLGVLVESVNHGIFSREKLSSVIAKCVRGWERGPKTIDARILKLIAMTSTGKVGNKFAEKAKIVAKKNENGDEIEEKDPKQYEFQGKYADIENLGIENGFSDKFLKRLLEMRENYSLEAADISVLRLLVSSEIHMENIQARQCRAFSIKRLKQTMMLLEIIKSCMEALKLTRKQRRVEADDSTEKDIEKKYNENRTATKDISKEEADVVARSKAAILEFAKDGESDDLDGEFEICRKCFSVECDGSCSEDPVEEE